MVFSSADPYPILWGLALIGLNNFMELKENNSMGSWLRETVKGNRKGKLRMRTVVF
ncbi:hypothetical protein C7972_102257 [Arenibacter sp. ARW7G5Y1]|nr:hypothetical protein C7972_102257 [Arenibacter sp. ARW7G5Y1]